MINTAFVITSAVNTKFGVYSSEQRLKQTLDTIESIRLRVPKAKICLLEMAALPLTQDQKHQLSIKIDKLIEFNDYDNVQHLYHSTDNWDIVKNVNEVSCFPIGIKQLLNSDFFDNVHRVFKISGRYRLNNEFNLNLYSNKNILDKIVVAKFRNSQFSPMMTGNITKQFMSRLWSWPHNYTNDIINLYDSFLHYMFERIQAGGYADIEHTLYHFLDHSKVYQVESIGLEGNIGPNGAAIVD